MTQAEEYEALVQEISVEVMRRRREEQESPSVHSTVRAVLAVIAEKAKEWPTESMYNARLNDWRTMLAASPLVKPEDLK